MWGLRTVGRILLRGDLHVRSPRNFFFAHVSHDTSLEDHYERDLFDKHENLFDKILIYTVPLRIEIFHTRLNIYLCNSSLTHDHSDFDSTEDSTLQTIDEREETFLHVRLSSGE